MTKLICVKATDNITKGEVYEVEDTNTGFVRVQCDDGVWREMFRHRFDEVPYRAVAAQKPGLKYDQGKPRMSLLLSGCPLALEAVGQVLTFGAQKYEAHSWQTVDNGRERYESALVRHLLATGKGESNDSESGLHHLAHAACNALFILELELRKQQEQQANQ